jgi:hypothetical protein
LAIVLDDIDWRPKMLWETSVAHGASKCLWARPFRTEVVSFMVIMSSVAWVLHTSLVLHIVIP